MIWRFWVSVFEGGVRECFLLPFAVLFFPPVGFRGNRIHCWTYFLIVSGGLQQMEVFLWAAQDNKRTNHLFSCWWLKSLGLALQGKQEREDRSLLC